MEKCGRLSSQRIVSLCLWHAHLQRAHSTGSSRASEFALLLAPRPNYVPVGRVSCPEVPFFVEDADEPFDPPTLQAPRVCQLCGAQFLDLLALSRHAEEAHGGWAEMRKRIFWEAEQLEALPLSFKRKRNMIANYDAAFRCSRPGCMGASEPRADVACVVCARKGWLESRFPVFLWKVCPRSDTDNADADDHVQNPEEEDLDADKQRPCFRKRVQPRSAATLKDSEGNFYFGEAAAINQLLAVTRYHELLPTIPLEELHASSVQHPTFPAFRWLLHSRRVPLVEALASERDSSSIGQTARVSEPGENGPAYRCAGVGDESQKAWICKECRDCLCTAVPIMPPVALANLMWGGREHPKYQNLTEAAKLLLSLGRPVMRKIVLGKGDRADLSSGLAGNTILLAQPTTGEICQQLPPARNAATDRITVVFTTARQDVKKVPQLCVSRSQYLECARLRQELCYAFRSVRVSEEQALELLPEEGVPECFVEDAIPMKEAQFFEGSLDGPAKMKEPGCKDPECVDAEVEDVGAGDQERDSPQDAQDTNLPGLPAGEQILGLDEASADDPLCRMHVLQRLLRELRTASEQLSQRKARLSSRGGGNAEDQVAIFASMEQCRHHFLSLRELSKKMVPPGADVMLAVDDSNSDENSVDAARRFLRQVLRHDPETDGCNATRVNRAVADALEAAPLEGCASGAEQRSGGDAPQAAECAAAERTLGLQVQAGRPLPMLESLSWAYSFTEFFYGDCLPRQPGRPTPASFEQIFSALLLREELEYHLDSDAARYHASPMSRWDSPSMVMVFASTLRSLRLLRQTKLNFFSGGNAEKFHQDLRAIAEATAEDFEQVLQLDSSIGTGSLLQAFQNPAVKQKHKVVHTALKHLLMQTATVPLTEGNKMQMRHLSFALSQHFGPLKLFMTNNFADTYSPLTLALYDSGSGETIGTMFRPAVLGSLHTCIRQEPQSRCRQVSTVCEKAALFT